MDRRFFETEHYLSPLNTNWKLPSVRAETLPIEPLSVASRARLRGLRRLPEIEALRRNAPPRACVLYTTIEETNIYVPTGRRRIKKNGELGAEEMMRVPLVKAFATVRHGKRSFHFRVVQLGKSPKATRAFDSRDGKRKPISEVRAELLRMCPERLANAAADILQSYLAE